MSACVYMYRCRTSPQRSTVAANPLHATPRGFLKGSSCYHSHLLSTAELRAPSSCRLVHERLLTSTAVHASREDVSTASPRNEVSAATQNPVNKADEDETGKKCVVCGEVYPLRLYQTLKHSVDGHFAQCRGCVYEDKQRRRDAEETDGTSPTEEPMRCNGCHTLLPAKFFALDPRSTRGRKSKCLGCKSAADQSRTPTALIVPSKICHGHYCNGTRQPGDKFSKRKYSPDGLYGTCRACEAYEHRERKVNPFSILDDASAPEAHCSVCGELKPASDFSKTARRRSGRQLMCKQCKRLDNNSYYAAAKALKEQSHPK